MRVIDLTRPIQSGMEVYPGDPEVVVEVVHTYESNTWVLRKLTMGSHTGTHVDAFSHMHKDGETLEEIPLERFFGKARLVFPNQPLPARMGLIFREEVGLDRLAAILAAQPPFVGGPITAELERALLKNEIVTFTGLINVDQLPADKEFMFYGFPLRIKDGDGSPVRAVAIID